MKLKYQGPEELRAITYAIINSVSSIIEREDEAKIVTGHISKIRPGRKNYRIITDKKYDSLISGALEELKEAEADHDYNLACRRLERACIEGKKFNDNPGYYHILFDVVCFAPEILANSAARLYTPGGAEEGDARDVFEEETSNCLRELRNLAAHEMLHWDIGDTRSLREVRELAAKAGISYTPNNMDATDREDCMKNSGSAGDDVLEACNKIIRLGIHDFVENAVTLYSVCCFPPPSGKKQVSELGYDTVEKLRKHVETKSIDFMQFVKETVDKSYYDGIHIDDLL